jgi:putative transposase
VEVLTLRGLVTYYVLSFIHLESCLVSGRHNQAPGSGVDGMEPIAGNATQEAGGHLHPCRYVLYDRDTKFCAAFRSTLADGGVKSHSASGEKSFYTGQSPK